MDWLTPTKVAKYPVSSAHKVGSQYAIKSKVLKDQMNANKLIVFVIYSGPRATSVLVMFLWWW